MRHNQIFCQYTQLSEKGVVWREVLLWLKLEKSIGELVEETGTDLPPPSTSNQGQQLIPSEYQMGEWCGKQCRGLMLGLGLLVGVVLTIGMVTKGCRTVVPRNAWTTAHACILKDGPT